jgi:transcriptional regulator with XRE-family HTH domain
MTGLQDRAARRSAARANASLVEDVRRSMADAGIGLRELARSSGVDTGYLARILGGEVRPSLDTYARIAVPMGLDLSAHLYPNTGPLIRDRLTAPMMELLLHGLHPRWHPHTEVGVRRPSRGWIDVVLHEQRERVAVASEMQSELRRLEQLIRWRTAKAESLPSWEGWAQLGDEPAISRLLLVRRTRATRQVANEFAAQLRVAYPAHPDDAIAALTTTAPWPGPALAWVIVDGRGARFVPGR